MLPLLVKEGYTYLVSALCIVRLQRVRVGGYYVNKRTPRRKLRLKRGVGA